MVNRRETPVRVDNQVLWIGAQAYPVHNIARAQTVALKPRRGRAVFRFLGFVLLWIVLAIAATFAINSSALATQGAGQLSALPFIVAGALILISFIALIRTLATQTLYALVIETSGQPHSALVTEDVVRLREIVKNVMDAINNPQVSYGPVTVNNIKSDRIGNIGDHAHIGTMNT